MPRCVLLEKGASITINGGISPCCQFEWQHQTPTDYKHFLELRQQKNLEMQTDAWIPECRRCKDDHDFKGDSMRDHVNQSVEGNFWELWFNNTCNLSCRMCNVYLSSTWANNVKQYQDQAWDSNYTFTFDQKHIKFDETVFFNDLPNVRHLKLLGGEPLLIKEVKRTLDYIVTNNFASNINLHLTTNLTQEINDYWKNIFLEFKSVFVIGSVDGLYSRYEYIRPGASFSNILRTVDQLQKLDNDNSDIRFIISCTGQTLNASQNSAIKSFWNTKGIDHDIEQLYYPDFMSYKSLRPDLRSKFGIVTSMEYDEKLWKKLVVQMKIQDQVHGTNFGTECSELLVDKL